MLPVQGSVYMLAGAGSNVTVQVGPNALFVVDTNEAAMSDKILAAIKTISPLPIRYIVNTSADPDHVGGNERFAKSAGDTRERVLRAGRARLLAGERLRADDEPEGRIDAAAVGAVADRLVRGAAQDALRHGRADRDDPSAGGPHRRRPDGLLPQVRRDRRRRRLLDRSLSGDRRQARRHARRRPRRPEPPDRHRHPGIQLDGRHARHSRARPDLRTRSIWSNTATR